MSVKLPFLYFKGKSSLDFNLIIKSKGSYNAPARDVTFTSVPGRNGDLIQDNGRYLNVTIPYELCLVKRDTRGFDELVSEVKNWLLSDSRYAQLWDSYDVRYFRYGAYSGGVDIKEELRNYGECSISFNCKPYRYSFEGQTAVEIPSGGATLENAEMLAAKPYIKIYGSGNISLHINSDTFTFENVSDYIEIDSETMNAYKGHSLQNNVMSGDGFPILSPGTNAISFTGSVTKAEIVPRWCTL